MSTPVPAELCDEIISYLWDDVKSLEACSLANKIMIFPCQRRLFHRISLGIGHKTANFFKLLMDTPHIAGYVKSLSIVDHTSYDDKQPLSEDPLDAPMVAYTESENSLRRRRLWLPQDKYLPDFAPLLCNLQALTISYSGKWGYLSFRVFNSLMHIMRQPSLIYVRLENSLSDCIFDLAMGENIKYLSVEYHRHDESLPVHQISHPPSGPVYIESLYAGSPLLLNSLLRSRRISTSRLRKIVLTGEGPATQAFLGGCNALEDLEVITERDPRSPAIDLGKLTTMARFTASLACALELPDLTLKTDMPWLHEVLLSGSTSANQALREITIGVGCYYGNDYYSISEWKEIFSTLDRYSNLAVLIINITMHNASGGVAGEKLFGLLDTCDDVGRLRTLKNIDVRVCLEASNLGRDKASAWTPWRYTRCA